MPATATSSVMLPDAPALIAAAAGATWLSGDGEIESFPLREAQRRLESGTTPMVCNARAVMRRLAIARLPMYDLLDLFAFVRPARFCLPTPRGLSEALGLAAPASHEDEAESLFAAASSLLSELAALEPGDAAQARGTAWVMSRGHWPWGPAVLRALGADGGQPRSPMDGLRVWTKLPKWEDDGPPPPAGTMPVEPVEARAALKLLLGDDSEERPQQRDYASAVSAAFLPRDKQGEPRLVLAEAGTGVGKTLGYIAPASVWARKNEGSVWISTFTRNLQRQLDGELDRLYPDPVEKARKVVVRKGRENYFCLLNYQEAVDRLATGAADPVALGLMARWALATRDGDMMGGDFPAWLTDLLGYAATVDMTDTRGECTYSACLHYGRCFIERSIRKARRAEIVVANHALVMVQAALGGGDEASLPGRYVFDEGHHVFGAADSAFSANLSGYETADLRRWILGAEDSRRSRARGLRGRIDDLIVSDDKAKEMRDEILRAAHALAGPGWRQRLGGGTPVGPTEKFLALVRQQVMARDENVDSAFSLECPTQPPVPGLIEAAEDLAAALLRLEKPVAGLIGALFADMDARAEELDTATRNRIEAVCRSLERRAVLPLRGWRAMLASLRDDTPPEFVDWLGIERVDGRDRDLGLHRHWVDPTLPFHEAVTEPAQGVLVTSATLRDASGDEDADWAAAEARTGARHARAAAARTAVPSPFDYPAQTRVLVVTDVNRNRPDDVAAAYRALFMAAGGGALGLFTAINRLRAVYQRLAAPLDQAGIELLAQHVDPMDTGTLIDIFRASEDACLLGTDAVRDGVDVPGRSLRLIVFDRVPWPRPDILHKARRQAFGGRAYEEMLTRLKLKQAYGRLVRRAGDRGVFVMLDRALPSRLSGAFPEWVEVMRMGLLDAVAETKEFLALGGRQHDQQQADDQRRDGAPERER